MTSSTNAPPEVALSPHAAEFDFWVGEWALTWGDQKENSGTNTITKILDGKVIFEHFVSQSNAGYEGMSHSVFDAPSGLWKQTWVDSQGAYLDFKGGWADDKMMLRRELEREGRTIHQRMVWYSITPTAFEWNWERSLDGGQTWEILWHITYQRK